MKRSNVVFRLLSYISLIFLDFFCVKASIFLIMKITGDRLISMSSGIIIGLTFMQILFSLTQMKKQKAYIRLIVGILVSLISFLIVFILGFIIKIRIDDYDFYGLIVEFMGVSILVWVIIDCCQFKILKSKKQ